METSYLKVAKSFSPGFAYPNFDAFIDNLNSQEMEWYATFRAHVTDKIEDWDFEDLMEDGIRTLLPVKTLAAMIIMKEGFGWGDAQLINECKNDLRVRHALAISEAGTVPTASMMNKFSALLDNFEKNTGLNLMVALKDKLTAEKGPVMKLGGGRIMLWAMRVA